MQARRSVDLFAFQSMILLCAIWGSQQIAFKLAAGDLAPVAQAGIRSIISSLLMATFISLRGEWKGIGRVWRSGLLAGSLFCLEFLCISSGLMFTSASHMVVLLYSAPIFSAIGLHLWMPQERLQPLQWAGIALCFAGIAMAFGEGLLNGEVDHRVLLGDLLALLGGVAWGATTVVVRCSRLSMAPASQTLFFQIGVTAVLLSLLAASQGLLHQANWTPLALGSVIYQGVVVSFFSYFAWFWLLRRYRAAELSVFSFMTPLFGVSFGVLLLDERLSAPFVAGALMVLLGITLVSAQGWWRRRLGLAS